MIDSLINKVLNYFVINDENNTITFNNIENLKTNILNNNNKIKCDGFYIFKLNFKNIYYDSDLNLTYNSISSNPLNNLLFNFISTSNCDNNIINQNIIGLNENNKLIPINKLKNKNLFLYQTLNPFNIKWIYNVMLNDNNNVIWGNLLLVWTHDIKNQEDIHTEIKTITNIFQTEIKNS